MKKKKQHTIPNCYLENFTDADGNIWVLTDKDKIFSSKPKNILTENHFYTVKFPDGGGTFIVEDTLANIEDEFITAFRNKIVKKLPLEKKERAIVSIFVASMLSRTKPHRQTLERFVDEVKDLIEKVKQLPEENKRAWAAMPHSDGPSISEEEFMEASKDMGSLHSISLIETLPEISQIIYNMKWCFLVPEEDFDYFITSDNPCSLANPPAENKYGPRALGSAPGLNQKDVELILPLSSKTALLCGWQLNQQEYINVPIKTIDQINYRSVRQASEKVISSSKKKLEQIIQNETRNNNPK